MTTAMADEVKTDYTDAIVNADLSTEDGWYTEGTKGISGGMVKVGSQAVYDFSQTITVPAGQYKLTAKAVYRYGADEQAEYDAIQAGTDTHKTKLYAETSAEKFEVNVFNRNEGASDTDYAAGSSSVAINGKYVPNSSSAVKAWFDAGQYVNELVFDVLEDGQVKIGITTAGGIAGDYVNIGAWTLTRLGDVASSFAEIDKTNLVGTGRDAWQGSNGGPVTIDGIALPEKYEGTTATLGDVMWQTVEGLDNGTYIVELYANARYTPGRGFASDATDGADDLTYLYANNVEISIPVYHNGDLNNGQSYTLEGVEVTDGTLKMGMTKKEAGSNWHTIQIKALRYIVTADAALADAKAALLAVIDEAKAIDPATAELIAAIETAQGIYDSSKDVDAVKAAVAPLQAAIKVAKLANASKDNPVLTDFVVNGTFDTAGVTSPWKTTTGAQNQTTATNQSGAFSVPFFENWNPNAFTGKIYQTIEGIPNGVYELSICAFVNNFDASCQYVYGNDAKTYLTAADPTAYKVVFAVTEGTAEIGFEQTAARANWCGIDNVSLTYYGSETTVEEILFGSYIEQVAALRATATELLSKVNEANKTALNNALAATETIEGTIEAYEAAIAALTAANNAAKANADAKTTIDNYYDLIASTNVYTQEAYETFKSIADGYLAKWEANELTETVVNPYAIQGWHADVNYDDFLLSAFGTNNFDTDLYINTWSTEGENDGSNFKVPFFEYWTGDENSLPAATKTATITGLVPGGLYQASAWVRVRAKNGQTDPTGITLSVGANGTPVDVTEGAPAGTAQMSLAEYTAVGVADANGNLTINFTIAAENNISWLSFKNVKYAQYGKSASNLDFSEGTPVDKGICTYSKDMADNGTTYCHQLEVPSWTIAVENNDNRAAGVFAYGSDAWLGSSSNIAPATNPEGVAEGNALGVVAVWDAVVQYTQEVTLAPGNYVLTIPVYNVGQGTTAPQKSLIGFIANDGTEYLAPAKSYTKGAWTTEVITFTLDEITEGVLSLGYDATNAGSGSQQALFFDCVKIESVSDVDLVKADLAAAIAAAQATVDAKANVGEGLFQIPTAALDTYAAAVATAQGVYDNAEATVEDVTAAIDALAAATAAYAATPVTAPAADKTYQIMHEEAGTYLTLDGGVNVEAEASPLSFVAAGEDKFYIANAAGEYAYYSGTGNNIWSLSVSTENKEAWTITAVGEGVYTIKGKNGHLGTDAATAGSTCFGDKAATNWVITEYVAPVEFAVTLTNPAGAAAEKLVAGDFIKFTTNMDDKVGYIMVNVIEVNNETSESEYVTSYRSAVKGEGEWSVELFSDMKFREGCTYKFQFTAYENEDAYNQEPLDQPGSAAIGIAEIEVAGTLKAYVYAEATLASITPAEGAVIESETDNVVTVVFTAPVKVVEAQSMEQTSPMMRPTINTLTPEAVDADANGLATTWNITIPLLPGYSNLTFAAEDAEGRRVLGNMGEEETSYFSYEWACTVGIPDFTVAPEGEVEGPVSTLTITCEQQIDPYFVGGAVYNADGEVVANFDSADKVVDPSIDTYTSEWYEALATAPVTVYLTNEITEAGTYTVKFEANAFMIAERYQSKATEATFTIVDGGQVGINGIAADDVVKTQYFGINGAAIDAPVKGINIVKQTLKDGKVVTSKVFVK